MDPAHASCDAPEEDSTATGGYLESSPPKVPLYDQHPIDEGLTDIRGRRGGGNRGGGLEDEDKKPPAAAASAAGRRSTRRSSRASQLASLDDGAGEDAEVEEDEAVEQSSPESPTRRTSRRAREKTAYEVSPIS